MKSLACKPDKRIGDSGESRAPRLTKKSALQARDLILKTVEDCKALVHHKHSGRVPHVVPATPSHQY